MSIERTDGAAALQSGHSADTRQPETDATVPQPGHDAATPQPAPGAAASQPRAHASRARLVRALACMAAVALGFFLMEFPANDVLFSMDFFYVAANLGMLAALFAIVYTVGQRSRGAIAAFLAVCLLAGVANHFVIAFKGQPVVPADLFALNTAAAVSGGYSFWPDERVVACGVLFAAACIGLRLVPKAPLSRRAMAANAAMAVVLVAAFGTWINVRDIGEDFHCVVGEWNTRASYADQGTTLCFLKRVQDLSPKAPAGYSAEEAERLLAEAGAAAGAGGNGSHEGRDGEGGAPGMGRDGSQEGADKVLPTVIAIMNETFSDLSRFESLEGTAARPTHYYELAQESLAWGTAYASAFGAGTCNSEFEFLTGSSMGNFGDGVYPYVLYDLGGNENLVTYFKSLGYATRAIHPAAAANWRRDRVYGQLGFDAFDDISAFEGAETLRGFTTDRETYDYVLDLVEEGAGPQFVFDVTIQNHGGYDTGLVPSDLQVTAPVDGVSFAEVDEYASCLAQSDEDLAYLVERLRALDEPVVVCFFGDHQPAFDDALAEAVYGDAAGAAALEDVQERYAVPYLVWANYDVEDNAAEGTQDEGAATDGAEAVAQGEGALATAAAWQGTQATDTSLNYLGAELVRAAGLPTTDYLAFLESLRAAVPALNLNGFMDAEGAWHAFDQKPSSEDARETQNARDLLRGYAIVQYANLFG